MLFGISALIAAAQLATQPPVAGQFEGLCQYSAEIREAAVSDTLINCSSAAVDGQGIRYWLQGFTSQIRFSGRFEGDRMVVHSVTVRDNDPREARGLCQVYYANEQVSVISCTAVSGARSWVANFVRSRI